MPYLAFYFNNKISGVKEPNVSLVMGLKGFSIFTDLRVVIVFCCLYDCQSLITIEQRVQILCMFTNTYVLDVA